MVMGTHEYRLTPAPSPTPIEITSWIDEGRDIITIKISQIQADGTKRGCKVRLTKELALRYTIGEGQEYPEIKPAPDPCPNC